MKEGNMTARFNPTLVTRIHRKGVTVDDLWAKWFQRVMKTFRETKAEIVGCVIDSKGNLKIKYLYGGGGK